MVVLGEDGRRGAVWGRAQEPEGLQVAGTGSGAWLLRMDFLGELALRQGVLFGLAESVVSR